MPRSQPPRPLPPIYILRGQRVMLDRDLAGLYRVATKVFNQTIGRNAARFPRDFAFQVDAEELAILRSQIVTSSPASTAGAARTHGGVRYLPWAFTEHGAIMAATLLRSDEAVAMSVFVVRAFVRVREELATSAAILKRLAEIDKRLLEHDVVLQDVVEKLLPLLNPPDDETPKRQIGFLHSSV